MRHPVFSDLVKVDFFLIVYPRDCMHRRIFTASLSPWYMYPWPCPHPLTQWLLRPATPAFSQVRTSQAFKSRATIGRSVVLISATESPTIDVQREAQLNKEHTYSLNNNIPDTCFEYPAMYTYIHWVTHKQIPQLFEKSKQLWKWKKNQHQILSSLQVFTSPYVFSLEILQIFQVLRFTCPDGTCYDELMMGVYILESY